MPLSLRQPGGADPSECIFGAFYQRDKAIALEYEMRGDLGKGQKLNIRVNQLLKLLGHYIL